MKVVRLNKNKINLGDDYKRHIQKIRIQKVDARKTEKDRTWAYQKPKEI